MDLKDKMTEVAGTALKAADSGDRLESTDDKAKSQMLSASVGLVTDVTHSALQSTSNSHHHRQRTSNSQIANDMLTGNQYSPSQPSGSIGSLTQCYVDRLTPNVGAEQSLTLQNDNLSGSSNQKLINSSGDRENLMTVTKRRQGGGTIEGELKTPEGVDKKLRNNRKKLQSKLRSEYDVQTKIKGGLVSDLRIEQEAKSKLYDAPTVNLADVTGDFGKKMLHMVDDMADDDRGTGIQNAWVDSASKLVDTSSKVYTLSRTAKYWRLQKEEAQIDKLARQRNKIMRNGFRLEYRSALKTAKEGELWESSNLYERHLQKKAIKKRYMKNAIKQYENAKKAGAGGKVIYNTGFSIKDKLKDGAMVVAEQLKRLVASPMGKIALSVILVTGLIFSLLGAAGPILLMSFGGDETYSNPIMGAGYPPEVEQWRAFVTERMTEYGYPDFVNAILATIQQESGGVSASCGGDIMQDKASGYWENGTPAAWNTYSIEQKSIDAGCRYFITGLESWGVTKADDYDGLQMVAQGYNYGYGFHTFAKGKSATKWTLELSTEYSNQQAASHGWSSYGHKPYADEWLKKYQAGGVGAGAVVVKTGPEGVMQTAQNQIGITEDPPGTNTVVFNTEYYGSEVSGSDYPWCCVFVWWVFNHSGNGEAFYGGNKTASCSTVYTWAQNNHLFINPNEAKYGDIVLFANNEHIELVVSRNSDGSYTTIGGNTSTEDAGSQSNGGCVAMRTRYTSGQFPITSFIRPPYKN